MKTTINDSIGVVVTENGSGLIISGRDHHEAPFDQCWDDLYAFIDEGVGPASLTYEAYRDTGYFMRFFRHNQDDNIFMTYQMSHQWDPTTDVRPHMHVIPMASGSGVVKMNYMYTWCLNNGELPAASGWTSGSMSSSFTPADQYKQHVMEFGSITPPADAAASSIIVFKVERPGSSDVTDTYQTSKPNGTAAANLGVLFFDLHYQKIKAGTVNEYS